MLQAVELLYTSTPRSMPSGSMRLPVRRPAVCGSVLPVRRARTSSSTGVSTPMISDTNARGNLAPQPAAFALAMPSPEQQRRWRDFQQRGCRRRRRRGESPPLLAVHEGHIAQQTVPNDGIVYAVRGIQGRDLLQRL